MKHIKTALAATTFILALAAVSLAGTGPGTGMPMGKGPGMGQGMGQGMGNCCCGGGRGMMGAGQSAGEQVTREQATAALNTYVTAHFKGYSLGEIEAVERPRGTMYATTVTDAAGNAFILHVNPWGMVRGPFVQGN